ncbi:MAG TPA: YetF domain-containing protein [Candidatus Binatia bacterium]|nr:YetF domain-containing protein [Candidatus Binatia bacterium]
MGDLPIFFKDWGELARVVVLSLTAYLALITLIRLAGKRTLAKMNVFDFVFVVALGSTLSTTIMHKEVTLSHGVAATATLIAVQVLISWLTRRSHQVERIVNGEPRLLIYRGKFVEDALSRERVTEEEVRAAVRAAGLGPFESVHAVVLETDGTFSVVWHMAEKSESSLCDVRR